MFIVRHLLSHGASWRTTYLQGIDPSEIIDTVLLTPPADHLRHRRADPLTTLAIAARRRGGRPCRGKCLDCRSVRRQPRCDSGPRAAQSATKQYCGDVRGERLIDTDSGDPAVDDVGVDAVRPPISSEHRALIDDAPGAAVLTGDDRCV